MKDNYLKDELYTLVKSDSSIFEFLQEGALDGLWYWDLENKEQEWMSPKFWETFGFDPRTKEHLSKEWQSLIHPEDLAAVTANLEEHLADKSIPFDQVVRYTHKYGFTVWVRCRGYAIRDKNNKPIRLLGAHTNVTSLKHIEQDLSRIKNEYETVFNGTQDAMFLIRVMGPNHFIFVRNNASHQRRTGVTLAMIEGKTPHDLLGKEGGDIVSANYQRCVDAKKPIHYEEELVLPRGKRIWDTTLSPILEKDTVTYIVGSATDITKSKALEQDLERRANYDALTNLMNRGYLYTRLEAFTKSNHNPFTIFFIDLDDFKAVNDTYGHKAGDTVLIEISTRISSMLEATDCAARLGGDEFAIVRKNMQDDTEIEALKTEILKTIARTITLSKHPINMRASIGHATYPIHGKTYDELLHHSDQAMYKMKQNNKR